MQRLSGIGGTLNLAAGITSLISGCCIKGMHADRLGSAS
jgi:hypothetical protein